MLIKYITAVSFANNNKSIDTICKQCEDLLYVKAEGRKLPLYFKDYGGFHFTLFCTEQRNCL